MHTEGLGLESHTTFTPNLLSHGIYLYRPVTMEASGCSWTFFKVWRHEVASWVLFGIERALTASRGTSRCGKGVSEEGLGRHRTLW